MSERKLTAEYLEDVREAANGPFNVPAYMLRDALHDLGVADAEIARFKTVAFQAQEIAEDLARQLDEKDADITEARGMWHEAMLRRGELIERWVRLKAWLTSRGNYPHVEYMELLESEGGDGEA